MECVTATGALLSHGNPGMVNFGNEKLGSNCLPLCQRILSKKGTFATPWWRIYKWEAALPDTWDAIASKMCCPRCEGDVTCLMKRPLDVEELGTAVTSSKAVLPLFPSELQM